MSLEDPYGKVQDVIHTDFVRYRLGGEIMMTFIPGCLLDGMVTPQYPEALKWGMKAELRMIGMDSGEEQMTIEIGDILQEE